MDAISRYINEEMNEIEIKVSETKEEFIFKTIYPFCVSVIPPQEVLKKCDLEQALVKHFPKSRIYDNGNWLCPSCSCQVHGDQKYCDFCGQHMKKIET